MRLASIYTAPNEDDTLVLPPHVTAVRDADAAAGASRLLDKTPVLAIAQRTRSYIPDTLNVYGSWSVLARTKFCAQDKVFDGKKTAGLRAWTFSCFNYAFLSLPLITPTVTVTDLRNPCAKQNKIRTGRTSESTLSF